MPSFRTLVISATIALASFTAAAPVNIPPASLPTVPSIPTIPSLPGAPVARDIPGVVSSAPKVPSRLDTPPTPVPFPIHGCDCDNLPALIAHVEAQVIGIKAQLDPLVGGDVSAVVEAVTPLLEALKGVLAQAVSDVKGLVGAALNEVLADANGVLSLLDISHLISNLLTLIANVIALVLEIVGKVNEQAVLPLIWEIGTVLYDLLTGLFAIVGGLQADLVPLVSDLVPTLTSLGLINVAQLIKS
jgi:hypothetical protein